MKPNITLTKENLKRVYSKSNGGSQEKVINEMGCPSYLYGNAPSRWFAWKKVELVLKACGDEKSITLMDFGCGSGLMFEAFSRYADRIYAVDIHPEVAKLTAQELGMKKVVFVRPDEWEQVVPDASIDLIVAANVLEHVEPLEKYLEFFSKKQKNNGKLIVCCPTENKIYRLGRSVLRWAGHKQFDGSYHISRASSIFQGIKKFRYREIRVIHFPLPGFLALYWIGVFKKNE